MLNKYKKYRYEIGIMWWCHPASLLLIIVLIKNGWNIKVKKINTNYIP
jgi:hypothetical protein